MAPKGSSTPAENASSSTAEPDSSAVLEPERIQKWVRGEMTLRELRGVSGPEMFEMARIAYTMYEQGRYDDAKVLFHGLASLDPKEGYYLTALGAIYLVEEDLDQAERCFDSALRVNPKEIATFVNRGEVYLRKGKVLEAAQDFKSAVDLDPENKDPLSHRARMLAAAALETLQAVKASRDAPPSNPAASGTIK